MFIRIGTVPFYYLYRSFLISESQALPVHVGTDQYCASLGNCSHENQTGSVLKYFVPPLRPGLHTGFLLLKNLGGGGKTIGHCSIFTFLKILGDKQRFRGGRPPPPSRPSQ